MRLIFALLIFLLPTLAMGQNYPVHNNLYVNDLANIITEEDEKVIRKQLETLRKDHGVEATVLTIDGRKIYGDSPSIESFATRLFNRWGIGNAKRNDGILILIARNDREMRVELGTGYGDDFNAAAGAVIDDNFLPSFSADNYSKGIRVGTGEVIRRIAIPFAQGADSPISAKKGWDIDVGQIGFFAMLAGFFGLAFRRRIGDFFARMRSCPNCGRKGLHRHREVTDGASTAASGSGILTTTCDYCDYRREQNYTIPRRSSSRSSSGSGFGGGSSSGGGASGRW